jgi:hypothetical protein
MLDDSFVQIPERAVGQIFGHTFVDQLRGLPVGLWTGPVVSGYGVHVVRIDDRKMGSLPEYEAIKEKVAQEYAADQRRRATQVLYENLLGKYEVVRLDGDQSRLTQKDSRSHTLIAKRGATAEVGP